MKNLMLFLSLLALASSVMAAPVPFLHPPPVPDIGQVIRGDDYKLRVVDIHAGYWITLNGIWGYGQWQGDITVDCWRVIVRKPPRTIQELRRLCNR